MQNLFSEFQLKGFKIKNRVVMPPLICPGWAGQDGKVSEKHIRHYRARAEGGVGLIIVEATAITPNGRLIDSQLGIWSDAQIEGFKRITEDCHRYGSLVMIQIMHGGLLSSRDLSPTLIGPSAVADDPQTHGLSVDEIQRLKEDFIKAALRARQAGFDGVEIHGAHGFLLSQFASDVLNRRDDEYGGDISGRLKLSREIVRGVRQHVGNDFIIGYRLGANSPTLAEGIEMAKSLEEAGVDILHVSHAGHADHTPEVPAGFHFNWKVYCGTEVKKNVGIPVIAVDDIKTPERADYLVKNELVDFTAIGRDMLTDSHWAQKALIGEKPRYCLRCKSGCGWAEDRCVLNKNAG